MLIQTGVLLLSALTALPVAAALPQDEASQQVNIEVIASEDGPVATLRVESAETRSDEVPAEGQVEKRVIRNKIRVVGPDGQAQEYVLESDGEDAGAGMPARLKELLSSGELGEREAEMIRQLFSDGLAGDEEHEEHESVPAKRPMIGIQCEAVDGLLRKHLKLGDSGLIVQKVIEDLPAAEAGILADDIILKANGENVGEAVGLVKAVMAAGDSELTLELLRDGDRIEVSLKPRIVDEADVVDEEEESVAVELEQDGQHGPWGWMQRVPTGPGQSRFRVFGPGFMLDEEGELNEEALKKLLDSVRGSQKAGQPWRLMTPEGKGNFRMREMPGGQFRFRVESDGDASGNDESGNEESGSIEKQIEELRAQMEELKALIKEQRQLPANPF